MTTDPESGENYEIAKRAVDLAFGKSESECGCTTSKETLIGIIVGALNEKEALIASKRSENYGNGIVRCS